MSVDKIIEGINASPLEDHVKIEAIEIVKGHSSQLSRLLRDAVYMAPEYNAERGVAFEVMSLITPTLVANNVPEPNGRDTDRHIYVSIGGRNPVNYEVER